jgi:hypothetical protein
MISFKSIGKISLGAIRPRRTKLIRAWQADSHKRRADAIGTAGAGQVRPVKSGRSPLTQKWVGVQLWQR